MNKERRYMRIWKLLYLIGHGYIERKFKFTHDKASTGGACLVVSNHVTNWDPMLVALSFPDNNLHFVASEHLFRMGWISKLICFLVAPIARRKGSTGLDTAMSSLRTLKAGGSVCLFAEGECTWDGCSANIVSSTGTLARASGAPLVTYRLEGGYFSMPRWGDGMVRRGGMRGHVVNIYSPEQLRGMKPDEITAAINRDIYEDAWARQRSDMTPYPGRNLAVGIEGALFMCPACRRVGTLAGEGDQVKCSCGLNMSLNEYGFFEPAQPFETICEWDRWQLKQLADGNFEHAGELFSDDGVEFSEVRAAHCITRLPGGLISLRDAVMAVGDMAFELDAVSDMAVVRTNRLMFTHGDRYYEVKASGRTCIRKYYAAWKSRRERAETSGSAQRAQ